MYFNPARWDEYTTDGYIPFRTFLAYHDQYDTHLIYEDRMTTAMGVSLGYANARSGKDPKVRAQIRRLLRRARPEL